MSPLSSRVKTGMSMRYMSWLLCMVYACTVYAEDNWALDWNCTAELIKVAKKHGFRYLGKDSLASYDIKRNVLIRSKRHGTQCASVLAVVAINGMCVAGVAYQAKIAGVRTLDGQLIDLIETMSLNHSQQHTDIYSTSWAPEDLGRGGSGSLYAWAPGEGAASFDNCTCDGYTHSRRGTGPFHRGPISAILSTIYHSGSFYQHRIVTTDIHYACTFDLSGTYSAPLAAEIIALALESNPTFSRRDVQHLMVRASRPAGFQTNDWRINFVGRPVSHYYGYGLQDAGKLGDLARKWKAVKPHKKCTVDIITRAVLSNSKLHRKLTLKRNVTACHVNGNRIRSLEHIQADLTLTCSGRGDLSITLISPKKTISNLLTKRPYDETSAGLSDWSFMTTHCWDEDPAGYWLIQIENNGDSTNRGILFKLKLELHGTDERVAGRRMRRSSAQCAVRTSDGSCECIKQHQSHPEFSLHNSSCSNDCVYPLYVFGSICLTSCPPHYYESDGDSAHYARRCLPCHRNCHTCSGKQETDCLECPPYSTLDSSLSTCSPPVHPWDHRVTVGMDRTAVVLCILVGGPLVILFAFWAIAWIVSTVLSPCVSARNQAEGSPSQGSDLEARDVQMVIFRVTERPAENDVITSAFTNTPDT